MAVDDSGLTITITPGTVLHTKKSLSSDFAGELTINRLSHDGEIAWSTYKPLDEPNHSGTHVMHKVTDIIYFVKNEYWKVMESPDSVRRQMEQEQIEDLLEQECFDELDEAVKAIHKMTHEYWDSLQVLGIVQSRVKMVWNRANAHAGLPLIT